MKFISILKKKLPVIIAFLVITLCAGLIIETLIIYFHGTDGAIYSREIAKNGLGHFLPLLVLLLVLVLLAVIWHIPENSQVLNKSSKIKRVPQQAVDKKKHLSAKIYILIYLAGLILIIVGIYNGGLKDVLIKAANICTECIGLG